jgi:hypothetical protein
MKNKPALVKDSEVIIQALKLCNKNLNTKTCFFIAVCRIYYLRCLIIHAKILIRSSSDIFDPEGVYYPFVKSLIDITFE